MLSGTCPRKDIQMLPVSAIPCQTFHSDAWTLPRVAVNDVEERFYNYTEHRPLRKPFRVLAFYLPQFHPFPENDRFWGKGFTEWSNVAKAAPLFDGHHQPHLPLHGFYDLRIVENMVEQARVASNYGIDGFVYYLYWFNGRFIMDRPMRAMLAEPAVNASFCFMWANENWSRRWDGSENDILLAQNHSLADSIEMMTQLLPFFKDKRYVKVGNSPVFGVYHAQIIPQMGLTIDVWNALLKRHGFDSFYMVAAQTFGLRDPTGLRFDAALEFPPHVTMSSEISRTRVTGLHPNFTGNIFSYAETIQNFYRMPMPSNYTLYPASMMGWDNTARKSTRGNVYHEFTLKHFRRYNKYNGLRLLTQRTLPRDARFMFINAWNEWAEGTHLEPDRKFGYGYLQAVYEALADFEDPDNFIDVLATQRDPRITGRPHKFCMIIHAYYPEATQHVVDRIRQGLERQL